MAKKNKNDEGRKAKLAAKKSKQATKATKLDVKARAKFSADGGDADDVDLDTVLEQFRREQERFLKVTETVLDGPPPARSSSTLMASPWDRNNLLLFGGEYFNGSVARFFGDLHFYYPGRDEWRCVTSPNAPLPRSGHAWTRATNPVHVYLFGGEFSSPRQATFHHYSDLWRLDLSSREWNRLEPRCSGPPARSGHRMTYFKQYIVLFGGFQDTSHQTRYLADLWLFDTANLLWHCPTLPSAQLKPEARSSFSFLPHEKGAVLIGGYSRARQPGSGRSGAGAGTLRSVVHQDCFLLRITPPMADAPRGTPPVVRWERRKRPANAPTPPRAGATMAWHKGRGILFGGVHDVDETDERITSDFFNGLFAWNIDHNRFFPLVLRKRRVAPASADSRPVGRRARGAQANEHELLRQLAALEAVAGSAGGGDDDDDDDDGDDDGNGQDNGQLPSAPRREMPVLMELPRPRFNAQLAVQGDVLYIYGGTVEKGDREFTLDDLYAVDLGKLDGCREIFQEQIDDWVVSDNEDDEDNEDDDGEDDDEMDDEDGDDVSDDGKKCNVTDDNDKDQSHIDITSPSKRVKRKEHNMSVDLAVAIASQPPDEEEEMETPDSEDDGLPHPRPFESRREFFVRTTKEWQDILLVRLGADVSVLGAKEFKTRAFALSEATWWNYREEITVLEEAQEAAGIAEVVSLAERGDAGGVSRRR